MSFVKRILSLILALVLVIGLLPVTARAGALDNGLVYEVCEDHAHVHQYTSATTDPTCTEQGFTTYTCVCGDSYVADFVDPLGHDYADGICNRCGEADPSFHGVPNPSDPSNGRFAPNKVLTRGMFCYALWNFWGSPAPSSAMNPFTDLNESDYYYDAVLWAVESGITKGFSDTEFGADSSIIRAQAVTFLWRSFGSPEPLDGNPFTDVNDSDYFYKAVLWAVQNGYMHWSTNPKDEYGYIRITEFGPMEYCHYRDISWIPESHPHKYASVITAPTCTVQGYTIYTCMHCDYGYAAKYVEAWGHDYADGNCIHCGEADPNYREVPRPSDPSYGIFAPESALTRGMFLYALWNYWSSPEPDLTGDVLTDVAESDRCHDAVYWAVESGIAEGISPTEFGANLPLTKAQAAAWLWNSFGSPKPTNAPPPFSDVQPGTQYADAVSWVCEEGYMGPEDNGDFGIDVPCLYSHFHWLTGNSVAAPEYLLYTTYSDHVAITGYKLKPTKLVIPAEIDGLPVTAIGNYAFSGCTSLTGIQIPDSVTYIGDGAFTDCSSLTGIRIPDGVTDIRDDAFHGCSSLARIHIPSTVTSIRGYAFAGCSSLTGIQIPDVVTSIEEIAFSGCSSLTDIEIPDGITYIEDHTFAGCSSLTSIWIPDGVTYIGLSAFSGCSSLTDIRIPDSVTNINMFAFYYCSSLTSIEIPYGITAINDYTFSGCSSLTSIHIPYSVTYIGSHAFYGCSGLTSMEIHYSVTHIGDSAFHECSNLTGIHVNVRNPNYSCDSNGVLFDKAKTVLIQAPGAITGNYTVPDSVKSIGYAAFYSCTGLTGIRIPGNVTSIEDFAFFRCYGLANIYFEGDAPQIGHQIFKPITATAYYPSGNPTWTEDVMQDYDGNITWLPSTQHVHEYTVVAVINPTCTTPGYTIYTCPCGDRFVGDHTPALGHECVDNICKRCGMVFNTPFLDVPAGTFYEEPVLWAVENGITSGITADSFNPDGSCLRAQVVTFLWRAANQPEPGITGCSFTDVKASDFFYKPVLWAVEQKITSGVSATQFGSFSNCNRAAVVTFLWRAAGSPEPISTNNPFTDVKSTDFFYKPVLWAVENNITAGMTATTFGPTAECNRAQVVTFLYRAYN